MKKFLFLFAFLLPVCLHAQLKINEIMTNNASAVMDDTKNYSMWVELINTSTLARNQNLYYLTDDLNNLKKWKPSSKLIAPGAFSVLWFERDEQVGHSNFKLTPEGGTLYLVDNLVRVVDKVIYPPQYRNISYGRKTDNGLEWVFFEQYSPDASNNNKVWSSTRCEKPIFTLPGGFYPTTQLLGFEKPAEGDTIHYTIDGCEPTRKSSTYVPGFDIVLLSKKSRVIRAKTFSKDKLSSDIATSTYFINTRNHHLPVVAIASDSLNLWNNDLGIYVTGNNNNFAQAWDRPANFELFDTAQVACLNQEIDVCTAGAYSRSFPLKSLKLKPRSKFGDSRLRYDFFPSCKPNRKYRDILLRNAGNDFQYLMMRDGFMHTLVMNRMDLDLLAYQPAVIYMNGVYFGIENLREETSEDYFYSNYGLNDDQVDLLETGAIENDPRMKPLHDYIKDNDVSRTDVYNKVCEMLDVDQYINYCVAQIYFANTDWPWNNFKMWRNKDGGKWRCLLYDTDFGFDGWDKTNMENHNTLTYVLGENPDPQELPDWSVFPIRKLISNDSFLNKFIDRFCVQISSTFETGRVNQIMDSLSNKISKEIVFHKELYGHDPGSFAAGLTKMKTFSAIRPDAMLAFISKRFLNSASVKTIQLSSNILGASYKMNKEQIIDPAIDLKYFNNRNLSIEANPVFGYSFKQWEQNTSLTLDLIKNGDAWKYFDGSAIPAANWYTKNYSDIAWKTDSAQFGYGGKGEKTVISYGSNPNAKYLTSYYRKTFTISDLNLKEKISLTLLVDDGAVIYLNGTELGRYNLPAGALVFNTLATSVVSNAVSTTFDVPKALLKEGENLISVEVHQANSATSDCVFDLNMSCVSTTTSDVLTDPIFSTMLSSSISLKAIYEKTTMEIPDDEATVVLNELVSSNNVYMDEFGGKDDYIELFNTGEKDVNIAGWYITDDPSNRVLAEIPTNQLAKTIVPAKGRIILWADSEPLQGWAHLGFKLGKNGETVILSRKKLSGDLVTVDSVDCPALVADMSFSCTPDGGPNRSIQTPTFNSKNSSIVSIDQPHSSAGNHSEVDIYPTLVSEYFTVKNASGMILTLTDLTGKLVYKTTCLSDAENVSTGSLQNGLYLVNVGNYKFKIVKR